MKLKLLLVGLILSIVLPLSAQEDSMVEIADKYKAAKKRAAHLDKESRKILAILYRTNQRVKKASKRTSVLTDKLLAVRANTKALARNIIDLEKIIEKQKSQLSSRLKLLYRLGGQSSIRLLFSSTNSHDFDRNLRYLKIISDHEFKFIRKYENNLKVLSERREDMRGEVMQLAKLQKVLKSQEDLLSSDQEAKNVLLGRLRQRRESYVSKMKGLRSLSEKVNVNPFEEDELKAALEASFFEQKGNLEKPIQARIIERYGLIYNEKYRYRLRHKGLFFAAAIGTEVEVVYSGKVAFAGDIPGYGKTVVIDHGDNYYSIYGNNSELKVSQGDKVTSREIIGKTGKSHLQWGYGLYFEIRHFSDAVDPELWLIKSHRVSQQARSSS